MGFEMAARTLPGMGLYGFWSLGEDNWNGETGMDYNLRLLSALAQPVALSRTTEIPETISSDGHIYIVPSDAVLNPNYIAIWDNDEWVYVEPLIGWTVYVVDDEQNVQFNGATWEEFAAAGGGGGGGGGDQQANLTFFAGGTIEANEVIFSYLVTQAITLPVNLTGSLFKSGYPADDTAVFTIKKNGASIGTLSWAATGTVPTVTFSSETSFANGDLFTITGPGSPDDTLANITASIIADLG